MPATFILTTEDDELASAWACQLPSAPHVIRRGDGSIDLQKPGARIWIRDLTDQHSRFVAHEDTVSIVVGEPNSVPFEDARSSPRNSFCLSYEESRKGLRKIALIAAELAEKRAILSVQQSRPRRVETVSATPFEIPRRSSGDLEFVEAAIENLSDLPRILDVCKRAIRARLRASRVAIFVRERNNFRAQPENWECGLSDPFVFWLQEHAGIVDADTVETIDNPAVVALLRQRMAEWNARLLLPVEIHGMMGGWAILGPRADGRAYNEADREEALALASLLSRFLGQNKVLQGALAAQADLRLLDRHGPKFRVVGSDSAGEESLPVEAREVVGMARRNRQRVEREFGKLRVSAGPIPENGGNWVLWDEAGGSADSINQKLERERYQILHDLGIIISHELSNALFSVSTYFQHIRRNPSEAVSVQPLVARVDEDMERLKVMPHILSALYEMARRPTAPVDMKQVIQTVAKEVGGSEDIADNLPMMWGHEENLRDAFLWLCKEIKATRDPGESGGREAKIKLTLQQRHREGSDRIWLVTISYPNLRLDQIKVGDATNVDQYPTVPIYLAREVIRFHFGTIHVGQGLDGPELNVALKSRKLDVKEKQPSTSAENESSDAIPMYRSRSPNRDFDISASA